MPDAIGDPVEAIVVERAQHTVGGDVHIGLEVAVAERDGRLEGRHRVLGPVPGPAPVGERNRTGMVEEREAARHGGQMIDESCPAQ